MPPLSPPVSMDPPDPLLDAFLDPLPDPAVEWLVALAGLRAVLWDVHRIVRTAQPLRDLAPQLVPRLTRLRLSWTAIAAVPVPLPVVRPAGTGRALTEAEDQHLHRVALGTLARSAGSSLWTDGMPTAHCLLLSGVYAMDAAAAALAGAPDPAAVPTAAPPDPARLADGALAYLRALIAELPMLAAVRAGAPAPRPLARPFSGSLPCVRP